MGEISYSIPQVGSPNATEDPKVATALTELLALVNGNLDTTNLAADANVQLSQLAMGVARFVPTVISSGSTATAADGELVVANIAGLAVTLPASPSDQQQVAVLNLSGTPTSPTVVNSAHGINGPGMSNATTFQIGVRGKYAIMEYSQSLTAWVVIGGGQDPGIVSVSGSATVTAGQTVVTSATGTTVTVPASPQDGDTCTVINGVASSTVTVAAAAGIYGPGVTGATTIPLSDFQAYVTLRYSSVLARWEIVAGAQNSGWVAISTMSPVNLTSIASPAAKMVGESVEFRNGVQAAASITSGTTLWTMPAAMRPPFPQVILVVSAMGAVGQLTIAVNGNVTLNQSLSTGNQVSLESLEYPVTG